MCPEEGSERSCGTTAEVCQRDGGEVSPAAIHKELIHRGAGTAGCLLSSCSAIRSARGCIRDLEVLEVGALVEDM